jgi:long-chain acyl-CoA synthetase
LSIFNKLNKFNKRIAIILNGNELITYSKLLKDSKKITNKITKRSLILVLGGNNYETISSYVGLINKKSVIIMIDKNISQDFLVDIIKKYKPNFIFSPKKKETPKSYSIFYDFKDYKILKKNINNVIKLNKDLAVLLTTSGTTGSKKFVKQSYLNYEDNSKKIINSIQVKKNSSVITTLPISYTFGLSIINTHLISGATIILNESSILDQKFWKLYNKFQPKNFYGVPFIFEMINRIGFSKLINNNLNVIANAGGGLNKDLSIKIAKLSKNKKIKFYNMYGQTEATSRMSVLNFKFSLTRPTSIGKPLKGGKFYLLSDANKLINKANVSGNLFYRGRNVSMGYSNSFKDLFKKDENKKIINTGDIAKFDDKGFFYIVGRKKRFIKLFGNRISLDEIEKLVLDMGFKIKCVNTDDKLIIKHMSDKIDVNIIKKKLSNLFKINPKYIDFQYHRIINNKEKSL